MEWFLGAILFFSIALVSASLLYLTSEVEDIKEELFRLKLRAEMKTHEISH
jgi:hypothetical protein